MVFYFFLRKLFTYASWKTSSVFGQVSGFDQRNIVAYRDCGLSFREIVQCDATVMRIFNVWMQEGTTDWRRLSHPPRFTIARDERHNVRISVMDRATTSRTIAQQIQSVTHHSVSARAIQRSLQQNGMSARCQLVRLDLAPNVFAANNVMDNGHGQRNSTYTIPLLPSRIRIGNTVVRGCWTVALGIATLILRRFHGCGWYWISLPHPSSMHCRYTEQPALYLWVVGARNPPTSSVLAINHIPSG